MIYMNLPEKCYLKYILFGLLSTLLSSLMRNTFPKRPLGALLLTLPKFFYDIPVGIVIAPPPHSIEAVYYFICSHRRVAVARYQMICLVPVAGSKCSNIKYFAFSRKNKEIRLSPMAKDPTRKRNVKMAKRNTNHATKRSITQRLRTDLGQL